MCVLRIIGLLRSGWRELGEPKKQVCRLASRCVSQLLCSIGLDFANNDDATLACGFFQRPISRAKRLLLLAAVAHHAASLALVAVTMTVQ